MLGALGELARRQTASVGTGSLKLPVNIAATLSFPASAVSDSVVNAVIAHFRRKNPQYGKLKRMGYAGNREPREYFLADVERGIVHVWRGAAAELRTFLADECGIAVQWVDRRLTFKAAGLQLGTLETRDNQQPAVDLLVKKHQGVLRGGTGTGKTETLLAAAIAVNQPTLVIVWNKDLLLQWKSRIAKYGILPANKIGEVHGGKKKFGAITVGMQQSLVKDPLTYAKHFGTLIFDECQRAPAETGMRVVNSFPAKYRWGASADERRTDRKEFLCYASIGEVVATIDRQESTLDPRFLLVPTDYEDIEYEEDRNYGALMNRVVWDEPRNKLIAEHLLRELRADAHVILFTERVEAALWWVDQVSSWGFKAGPLIGGTEFRDQVSATLAGLTTGKVRFAASTSYADVGLDVPILDTAFVTCPTAGNVKRLEQQVGRVVRPHPEKGSARVFYFWDRNVDGLGVKKFKNITKRWGTVEVLER